MQINCICQNTSVTYAAQWGREWWFVWHYTVGGLPYLKTGYALGAKRAERKAMAVYGL